MGNPCNVNKCTTTVLHRGVRHIGSRACSTVDAFSLQVVQNVHKAQKCHCLVDKRRLAGSLRGAQERKGNCPPKPFD